MSQESTTASLRSTRCSNSRVAISIHYDHQFEMRRCWQCGGIARGPNQEPRKRFAGQQLSCPDAQSVSAEFNVWVPTDFCMNTGAYGNIKMRQRLHAEHRRTYRIGRVTRQLVGRRGGAECIVLCWMKRMLTHWENLMFIGPCIIVIVEEWKTNLVSLAILFHFLRAQHVSDINISIIRSLGLCCWITTSVALFSVRCVLELWCGWF